MRWQTVFKLCKHLADAFFLMHPETNPDNEAIDLLKGDFPAGNKTGT